MAEVAESDSGQPVPAIPPPAAKPESSPIDIVLRVLGAIGTGIGILGIVTFFGAAILWVRADKAELPATEAVAAIPRNVLISTGAQFLFPALLYAVGLVALVFIVHFIPKAAAIFKNRRDQKEIASYSLEAADQGRKALIAQQRWKAADAMLDSLRENLDKAHELKKTGPEISAIEREIDAQRRKTTPLQVEAEEKIATATKTKAKLDTKTEKAGAKLERGIVHWLTEIGAIVAAFVLVIVIDGSLGRVSCGQTVVLLFVGIASAILVISVYWATENFVWFGVVAFVVVGAYLGAATYFNTHNNAKMQPVAVLRSGHDPVAGAFIADTSENVYVGTFREKETPPRLLVIPQSQVVELTVGPLLDQPVARRRALTMALNECNQTIKESPPTPPATTPPAVKENGSGTAAAGSEGQAGYGPACTPPQEEKLKAALERGPQTG
jgi:ABC-type multidrug transport system fused ATPase/permease subunit